MRSSTRPLVMLVGLAVALGACGSGSSEISSPEGGSSDSTAVGSVVDSTPDSAVAGTEVTVTEVTVTEPEITARPDPTVESTLPKPSTTERGRVARIVGTVIGIDYYGACGNETFDLDGVTWYPLPFEVQERIDVTDYEAVEAVIEPSGLIRVPPPGPGDDVGTLFTFEDGLGRFVSDSGLVDRWMTTQVQTYDFVC